MECYTPVWKNLHSRMSDQVAEIALRFISIEEFPRQPTMDGQGAKFECMSKKCHSPLSRARGNASRIPSYSRQPRRAN